MQRHNPADLILATCSFPRGGHVVSTLPTFRLKQYPIATNRAWWILQNKPAIPPTHDIVRTCDVEGCIEPEHQELRPKKQPKPESRRASEAWEENRKLKERVAELESQRDTLIAAMSKLECLR